MKVPARHCIKIFAAIIFAAAMLPAEAQATTIFLTSGTSWSVPSDWNSSNNTIEVIGGGANGVAGSTGSTGTTGGAPGGTGGTGGAGGGGGAYSKASNVTLTPSASVTYAVGGVAGDTYLCNSTSNCASIAGSAVVAGAKGASGTTGGSSASGVGSTKYSGGNGASGTSGSSAGGGCDGGAGGAGGGGGGAAGLHGAGNSGSGSSGGSGDAGNTAAGASGTQWDATHGSGGGAAGGTSGGGGGDGDCSSFSANGSAGGAGAAGGLYGAGGSGGKGGGGGSGGYTVCTATDPKFGTCISFQAFAGGTGGSGGALGSGRQGLIVITYTPLAAPTVTTNSAGSFTPATANLFGAITATGGADATQSGFAYGTVSTLNTVIATTTLGAQSGTASFTSSISGLSANTTYYYRAYATNSAGTGYGSILSFATGNSTPARRMRLFEGFKIKFFSGKMILNQL